MKSAIKLVLGLSTFAAVVSLMACSSSGTTGTGPVAVNSNAGATGTVGGGTGAGGGATAAGGSGASDLPSGVPLTPADGWVDGMSNTIGVQGAFFSYADPTTFTSLTDTIKAGMNCVQGTVAQVNLMCTVKPPATDCYGTTWGAAVGLNLNQPNVPGDGGVMMGGTAVAYDGTKAGITGFAFDISGDTVPTQANFRFLINDGATNQYCSPPASGIKKGPNVFKLADLIEECWLATPKATDLKGNTATNNIVKIAWQVVSNSTSTIPFNFCVNNIEALTN
jgi:hypothetical protein